MRLLRRRTPQCPVCCSHDEIRAVENGLARYTCPDHLGKRFCLVPERLVPSA